MRTIAGLGPVARGTIYAILFAIVTLLTACHRHDHDGPPVAERKVPGEWYHAPRVPGVVMGPGGGGVELRYRHAHTDVGYLTAEGDTCWHLK